jgi:hypothetical protein
MKEISIFATFKFKYIAIHIISFHKLDVKVLSKHG